MSERATDSAGRVLVLGAGGFLGRWLVRELVQGGAPVTAAVRDVARARDVLDAWGARVPIVAVRLEEPESAAALIASLEPRAVFNLTGYGVDRSETDARLAQRINAEVPEEIARACAALAPSRACTLVHVGSALEYGRAGGVITEATPCLPHTLYGETKLQGTTCVSEVARAAGLRAVTARLFTVYGPGEHPTRLFPTLCAAVEHDGPIPLSVGHQQRDFAYAEDVARSLTALASARFAPGEVVQLATGTLTTVRHFAERAAAYLGIDASRLRFGAEAARPDEMAIAGVSTARAHALLGCAAAEPLADALPRAVAASRRFASRFAS